MFAILFALVVFSGGARAFAQGDWAANSFYIELFGVGLFYSINYEYRLNPWLGLGLGATQWEIGLWGITTEVIGLFGHLRVLLGGLSAHHLETGISGGALMSGSTSLPLLTPVFGYRFQPAEGGLLFRLTLLALFTVEGIVPFFGVSLGGSF